MVRKTAFKEAGGFNPTKPSPKTLTSGGGFHGATPFIK